MNKEEFLTRLSREISIGRTQRFLIVANKFQTGFDHP